MKSILNQKFKKHLLTSRILQKHSPVPRSIPFQNLWMFSLASDKVSSSKVWSLAKRSLNFILQPIPQSHLWGKKKTAKKSIYLLKAHHPPFSSNSQHSTPYPITLKTLWIRPRPRPRAPLILNYIYHALVRRAPAYASPLSKPTH